MTPTLSEKHRAKLDTIVSQMTANGEPEENIRFVVSDFKTKYGTKVAGMEKLGPLPGMPPPPQPKLPTELAPEFDPSFSNSPFGKEPGYGVLSKPMSGVYSVVRGIEGMAGGPAQERVGAANEAFGGAMEAAIPFAGPSAVQAPLRALGALGAGLVGKGVAQGGLELLGVPEEYAEAGGNIASLPAGAFGWQKSAGVGRMLKDVGTDREVLGGMIELLPFGIGTAARKVGGRMIDIGKESLAKSRTDRAVAAQRESPRKAIWEQITVTPPGQPTLPDLSPIPGSLPSGRVPGKPKAAAPEVPLPAPAPQQIVLPEGHMPARKHTVIELVNQAVENKAANIAEYLRSNGINHEHLAQINPATEVGKAQLKAIAAAAYEAGKAAKRPVPKSGYKGLEGDTLQLVMEKLRLGK